VDVVCLYQHSIDPGLKKYLLPYVENINHRHYQNGFQIHSLSIVSADIKRKLSPAVFSHRIQATVSRVIS